MSAWRCGTTKEAVIKEDTFKALREALLDRRRQSHLLRQELDERWQGLHEREPELEEAASKENIARGLEEQNNQLQEQIESIDAALGRMDEGTYGKCESCRRPIAIKRLQAIPWTRMCLSCSQARGRLEIGRAHV